MYTPNITNDNEIWQQILSSLNFKRFSDTDYRLKGTNPVCGCTSDSNNNSPATSINPEKNTGLCYKCDKGFNLYELAKAIGIVVPTKNNGNSKNSRRISNDMLTISAEQIYKTSNVDHELIQKYFQTRRLQLSNEFIDQLGLKINRYNGKTSIVIPIINPKQEIKQLCQIFISTKTGEKVKTEQNLKGKGLLRRNDGSAVYKFNKDHKEALIFEGIEDALTYYLYVEDAKDKAFIVVFGEGNFKNANAHLKQFEVVIAILDDDASSLNGAKKLDNKVKLLQPTLKKEDGSKMDCNDAYKLGVLKKWVDSLQKIERESIDAPFDKNNLPFCFWYEEFGDGKPKLKINSNLLLEFQKSDGFFTMLQGEFHDKKILVRLEDNKLKEFDIADIQSRLVNLHFKKLPYKISEHFILDDLKERFLNGINVYVSQPRLNALPQQKIELLRDEKNKSFFFFENGVVEVSKEGIILIPYSHIEKPIWSSQIISFEIKILTYIELHTAIESFNFFKFLQCICTQRNIDNNNKSFDSKRFGSLLTVLGYLLHNFNDERYTKAIILLDTVFDGEPNGGTGKGILCRAIKELRKVVRIDGKKINFDETFALDSLTLDTQLVWYDDVNKNFPFIKIFSDITESYTLKQKFKQTLQFEQRNNPKTIISTNYTIKGLSPSHARRKFEFELFNYFDDKRTPDKVFNELFFSKDWKYEDWNIFYNLMFFCSMAYFNNNSRISEYDSETLETKRLIGELGVSFVVYADSLPRNQDLPKQETYSNYVDSFLSDADKRRYTKVKFGIQLKKYCELKGLKFEDMRKKEAGITIGFYVIG